MHPYFARFLNFLNVSAQKKSTLCAQHECSVFSLLHYLPFTRAFVVDATKMENAVDDDAIEFFVVAFPHAFGITPHGIEGNENIAIDGVALVVVESYDVGIVVVTEELAIYFQYFLVVTKHVPQLADTTAVSLRDTANPGCNGSPFYLREGNTFSCKCNQWLILGRIGKFVALTFEKL